MNVRHIVRAHALPLLWYAALALLMTWPLALNLTTAVPGDGVDSWQNIWNMWWLKRALLEGHNPFYTTAIYYPEGTSLLLHTLNPFNFLLTLPVQAVAGLVVAYNVALLGSLILSGYAAYLLAYDVAGNRGVALLAGTVFAGSGYVLAQALGHLNLIAVEWLPFSVLALRRASVAPSAGRILIAALCIALNVLCDWQYFLFALVWSGWYMLALLWHRRNLRAIAPVVFSVVLALLLVSPLLLPTAFVALQTPGADTGESYRMASSADLTDFLIPGQLHPLWGDMAARAQSYKATTIIHNKTAYLGVVALALVVMAFWPGHTPAPPHNGHGDDFWHTPRFWLASGLVMGILALGPQLHLAGVATGIPLPAALFYRLPFVSISRVPLRFMALAMIAIAMLAALGARRLIAHSTRNTDHPARRTHLLLAVLLALLLLDNLVAPFPIVGIYVPPFYAELGADNEEYAILESPFYARTSVIYMFYQAVHGKDLVGGYISREQPYPLHDQFPIVRLFAYAESPRDIIRRDMAEIAPSFFSYFNIRYLILHSEGGALRYNTLLRIADAAADGAAPHRVTMPGRSFLAYRVAAPAEPVPFLGIGEGWSPPYEREADTTVRAIGGSAEILVYSAAPASATLRMHLAQGQIDAVTMYRNGDDSPVSLPVQEQGDVLAILLDLPAGETRLVLEGPGEVVWIDID